jgi:hypothetical protein
MPAVIALYTVQFFCALHALKRGAPYAVIFLIFAFPLVGCAVYVVAVILPEFSQSRGAREAKEAISKTLDPDRSLRRSAKDLRRTDTVENRMKLADSLVEKGSYPEAIELYDTCLDGPYEDDPDIMLRLACALFEAERYGEAVTRLEILKERNPDYRSQDGHLLYARALEANGADDAADAAYRDVTDYFAGAEARYRYALFLKRQGQDFQAKALLEEILEAAKDSPSHHRKLEREWIRRTRQALAA